MIISGRPVGALLAVASLLLTAACASSPAGGSQPQQPGQLDVVVAFYPFQFIAERVAGDRARVQNLTQPGAEPHDLELTPRQVGGISSADLVIYERTFQPAVDQAVEQSGNSKVLDTTSVVPLQPGEVEPGHAHGPEETGEDPHVWLDPANMATITAEVGRRLSSADPEHASTYAANARSLEDQLTGLSGDFQRGLADCQRREFITTHAAFGYLARRYALEQIGITGLSPDAEPSPARIAEVQTEATEHGITTIFYETLVSPAVAQSMAGDLGLKVDVLDPIEGITDQSRGSDYVAVMRANLAALRTANGCP